MSHDEARAVAERYARRAGLADRYSPLRPENRLMLHERQRVMLELFTRAGISDLSPLNITEVGCGSGANLLELLRLGASPERLTGLELLPERHAQARERLPAATQVWLGNAIGAPIAPASQQLVLQATVFSSLLDAAFQQRLADAMWAWLAPGGALLWYDFTVNNPRNPDVRGVPLSRIRELFPHGRIDARRITLAPPLARVLCRLHPALSGALYGAFNTLPLLRTHLLAWIAKP